MATYPADATVPITTFTTATEVSYSSTGPSTTQFNLGSNVEGVGEVAAFVDGILQATSTYELANSGGSVSFFTAPNASNLTLKTLTIPNRFTVNRSLPTVRTAEYSNTNPTIVLGNTYSINSKTESFALPTADNVTISSGFMVFVSGVYQSSLNFTYPSAGDLGDHGIDIGDNTATKLLLNFQSNITDGSEFSHTLSNVNPISYDSSNLVLSGDSYLQGPNNSEFDIHVNDFTLDMIYTPTDNVIAMTSNQALFSRYEDTNNSYILRTVGANSNVGFIATIDGTETALYGGNVNADTSYHVAVSYNYNEQNLKLYVSNVLVDHKNFLGFSSPNANIEIGNTIFASETANGTISYVRHAKSHRYNGGSIEGENVRAIHSVISGAPLGSIEPNETLSIRIFDSTTASIDRFTSMADRKPDKGISSSRTFDTISFESQAGYEKRRLRSRRSKRSYDLQYTNITGIEKVAIENFYTARSGEFESFTFDLSHINEAGTINARFASPLQIDQVLSNGSKLTDNFYTITFSLREVFD